MWVVELGKTRKDKGCLTMGKVKVLALDLGQIGQEDWER